MKLTSVDTLWKKKQDDMIASHEHYITVYYKETVSGTSAYHDSFFGEALDPNAPTTRSGVVSSTDIAYVISGIIYDNQGSISLAESQQFDRIPIGRFEPGQAIFTCRITDAVVSGVNKLEDSKYVILSTDNEKYIVKGPPQKAGLKDPYVFHVVLARTNVESNA